MGYWGIHTPQNKALWMLFICCFIAGAVMLPLGWAKVIPCIDEYNDCRNALGSAFEPLCRARRDECGRYWARVWVAGVIMFVAAVVPLCIFGCCSKPPEGYHQGSAVPMATPMQPYQQSPYQAYQPNPYPPAPGMTYTAVPVEGQPVMYTAVPVQPNGQPIMYATVPQNGQPAAYYYPPPPTGGAYPYPPPPTAGAYPAQAPRS